MNLYEIKNIKKYYCDTLVLDIPSLTIEQGKFYIIYGPNGAGKTTLLNLLGFLDKPSEGEINFGNYGFPVDNLNRKITSVMQTPYIFKTTVFNNISQGLIFRSVDKKKIVQIIKPVMERLGLWELRNKNGSVLSAGEKKKVAIARSMVLDTDIILLDEPTANLDKGYINIAEDIIYSMINDINKTVIMTTHDLNQAYKFTSDIMYLVNGRIEPNPLWNVFFVNLTDCGGVKAAELTNGVKIYAVAEKPCRATVSIDPSDIIISRQNIYSSALNSFKSRIVSIAELKGLIDLVVDIGIPLHVFITKKSFFDMRLNIDEEVFVIFKASAVKVYQ
ncbi:MAG: ABC transporter ATP-binding protein [Elusimicrobia bacterium]|nr:ABC transporter ATP-binding protein [Elusimicrobiota bacterium]